MKLRSGALTLARRISEEEQPSTGKYGVADLRQACLRPDEPDSANAQITLGVICMIGGEAALAATPKLV